MKTNLTQTKTRLAGLAIAGLLLTTTAARAQKDLAATLLRPAAGATIVHNAADSVVVRIKNVGMAAIPGTDTIGIMIYVDSTMATMGGTMYNLGMGDSIDLLLPGFTYGAFTSDADNVSFCADVVILGNTDPTPANNNSCHNVNLRMAPTGIGNVTVQEVNIYPNPAADIVNIDGRDLDGATLHLTDMTGKMVARIRLNAGHNTLETSRYAPGVYSYRITGSDGRTTRNGLLTVRP